MLPDDGIWEVRGPRRHFTHSKVMAWVAFDRAIKDAESDSLEAPVERWREVRNAIHAEVCEKGFDARKNAFVQCYETSHLDASLLLIPQVGFLPPDDPRVRGTIAAIERELMCDGFVQRYSTETGVDALPAGEGVFLPCSFWLADAYVLSGRRDEGEALFERLLAIVQRCGAVRGRIRSARETHAGQFSAGLSPCRPDQYGARSLFSVSKGPADRRANSNVRLFLPRQAEDGIRRSPRRSPARVDAFQRPLPMSLLLSASVDADVAGGARDASAGQAGGSTDDGA